MLCVCIYIMQYNVISAFLKVKQNEQIIRLEATVEDSSVSLEEAAQTLLQKVVLEACWSNGSEKKKSNFD